MRQVFLSSEELSDSIFIQFSYHIRLLRQLWGRCKGMVDPCMVPSCRNLIVNGVSVGCLEGVLSNTVRHVFIYCIWGFVLEIFLYINMVQGAAHQHRKQERDHSNKNIDEPGTFLAVCLFSFFNQHHGAASIHWEDREVFHHSSTYIYVTVISP